MKQILLIGSLGQLGRYLVEALTSLDIELHVMNRLHMDLAQTHLIQGKLNEFEPDLIINASAYTAVDLAEKESELAYLINRDAPMEMAKYAYDKGIPFLHYSTDYVFSGKASTPYKEQDPTDPQGVYGASKLEGEHEVLDSGANAYIFRTAWVYSQQGKNFYNTMLNLAENRNELSIVNDQYGSPTYAGEIAKATVIIVEMLLRGDSFKKGVYHMTCSGETHWAEFAKEIFAMNRIDVEVNGITTSEYPTPAKRPAYSVLNNQKLKEEFGVCLPSWQTGLKQCLIEKS